MLTDGRRGSVLERTGAGFFCIGLTKPRATRSPAAGCEAVPSLCLSGRAESSLVVQPQAELNGTRLVHLVLTVPKVAALYKPFGSQKSVRLKIFPELSFETKIQFFLF